MRIFNKKHHDEIVLRMYSILARSVPHWITFHSRIVVNTLEKFYMQVWNERGKERERESEMRGRESLWSKTVSMNCWMVQNVAVQMAHTIIIRWQYFA